MEKGDYASAILELRVAESQQPSDWRIKRDLGIAYHRNRQFNYALTTLNQARLLKLEDSLTLLYLGLSYEQVNKLTDANVTFRNLTALNIAPVLKKELYARMRDNQLKLTKRELQKNLADWEAGRESALSENSVAVLYFRNLSEWRELDPVVKGVAEILSRDLSQVKKLRVVDRLKVQILMEELRVTPETFFDQIRASDAGRMLNAQRMISGGIERIDDIKIRINSGVVETATGQLIGSGAQATGSISDILKLEKALLRELLRDLKLTLTSEETAAIQLLPTTSSLAFIAFSKGLDSEDQQLFSQAQSFYQSALHSDPNFGLAKDRLMQLPGPRLSVPQMEKLAHQYFVPDNSKRHRRTKAQRVGPFLADAL